MSSVNNAVDSDPQTAETPSQSSNRVRLWRWLSTGLIVVGLLLLGAGGLMVFLSSAAVVEPPPAVGVVEPPPASLEENPLPALAEPELSVDALEAESPPSLEENPLPVLAEGGLSESEVEYAPSVPTSLPVAAVSSADPESEVGDPIQGASDDVMRQAEGEVPGGPPPTPNSDSVAPATSPPTRVVIPAIDLDSEVVPVGWKQILQNGKLASVWEVAEYAAGWHQNSTLPGEVGNVVLSGHHNVKGEVFRYIVDLNPGDTITLYADGRPYTYTVESRFVLRDKGQSAQKRQENARWIGSFPDERLTLVTCWPYTNNTHRVIVVAKPT